MNWRAALYGAVEQIASNGMRVKQTAIRMAYELPATRLER